MKSTQHQRGTPGAGEGLNRREFVKVVGITTVAASGLGLLRSDPAYANSATKRPISDFVNVQGTTVTFNPPVPDYVGWSRPFTTPPQDQRLALGDYAGIANEFIEDNSRISLETRVSGSVIERPLADGRAEVTVILHTENALTFVIPFALNGPVNQAQINPLLFGFRPQDIVANPNLSPGLGESHLVLVFNNTAFGAPLPDFVNAFILGNTAPGQELVSVYFHASASGPLRPAFGVPDGTPGRCTVAETGVLFRGPFKGATADGFPAELVELRVIGR